MSKWVASGNPWAAIFGIVAVGIAVFANSLFNAFNVDDATLILNNPAVHGLSPVHLRQILFDVANNLEYLPVRDITYAIDYSLWGEAPFGFHLSNLLYYLAACLALYFMLRKLAEVLSLPVWLPLAITLLFLLHPVHVESVASIASRKDLLSACFVFLSCHAFLINGTSRRINYYWYALLLLILALFSKGTAITAPFVLLMIDLLVPADQRKVLPARHAPFFAASAIYYLLQSHIMKNADAIINAFESTFTQRLATAFEATVYYIKLMILPYPLIFYRQFPIERDLTSPRLIESGIIVALIVAGAIACRKKWPAAAFFLGWFLITVFPVVGIVPTGTIVADRYLFLPSVAFCGLLVLGVSKLAEAKIAYGVVLATLIASIALSYALLVVQRNRDWRDSITLFEANLRQGSQEPFHYWIVGRAYFNRGNFNKAFEHFSRAASLHPPYQTDLGVMKAFRAMKENDLPTATLSLGSIEDPEKSRILDVAYLNGVVAAIAGDRERALWWYGQALQATRQLRVFNRRDVERGIALLQDCH